MDRRTNERLDEITPATLILGIDVAKTDQWARFVDYRGKEIGKAFKFQTGQPGFDSIITQIRGICNPVDPSKPKFDKVIVGMEPTGHYWKTMASYLRKAGLAVVCVNPYHTKKAKELDDNSPTASDKKEAIVIARLVKDGRFFDPYMPQDVFAELRVLTSARVSIMRRQSAVKNTITAIIDEYFPEFTKVFKKPLDGKASRQALRSFPFPSLVLA